MDMKFTESIGLPKHPKRWHFHQEAIMAVRTVLMICPHGHSFVTGQTIGHKFLCPECNQTFEDWEGYRFDLLT